MRRGIVNKREEGKRERNREINKQRNKEVMKNMKGKERWILWEERRKREKKRREGV